MLPVALLAFPLDLLVPVVTRSCPDLPSVHLPAPEASGPAVPGARGERRRRVTVWQGMVLTWWGPLSTDHPVQPPCGCPAALRNLSHL